jgi:two-component system, chemotaxis family, CheB/CheR fusion protein
VELRSAIEQASTQQMPVLLRNIEWNLPGLETITLDIQVTPLFNNGSGIVGTNLTINDVTQRQRLQQELDHTRQELETALEEVQSINEELETTNEELQSTVEELETTNEELQSTNEELETMNEELQSTNEELETINDELRRRTEGLNQANSFLESILTNLKGGVVVVDQDLRISIWNQKCEELWGLRANEVQGQNLLSLDIGLPVEKLKRPIRSVLADHTSRQEITLNAVNRRGKSIQCKINFLPMAKTDHSVQGVILVMEEIEV